MAHEGKTRLILIRHGESNVTVERILGGEELHRIKQPWKRASKRSSQPT